MTTLTPLNLLLMIDISLFILGVANLAAGIIILLTRSVNKQVQALANQTTNLGQKGLAEDISGMVGNASNLLDALNQLIRTTAGIGVFLCIFGLVLICGSCWLAIQLYPVWP